MVGDPNCCSCTEEANEVAVCPKLGRHPDPARCEIRHSWDLWSQLIRLQAEKEAQKIVQKGMTLTVSISISNTTKLENVSLTRATQFANSAET
jgi:hypothetical protein